jgi:hypothetical protein
VRPFELNVSKPVKRLSYAALLVCIVGRPATYVVPDLRRKGRAADANIRHLRARAVFLPVESTWPSAGVWDCRAAKNAPVSQTLTLAAVSV